MLFCEKCNVATTESRCPCCGNKKLRAVNDEDFCFFATVDRFSFEMLESCLKENKIEIVGVPHYSHVVTHASAGRADERKIYIRYQDREHVTEIIEALFGNNR